MKKIVFSILIIFLLFGLFLWQQNRIGSSTLEQTSQVEKKDSTTFSPVPTKPAEFTASFGIFTNNTFRVFTAPMYHNLSSEVFITAENPNVIQVTKANSTWNDFFTTLPFTLTETCLTTGTGQTFCDGEAGALKFYLNGVETPDLLQKEIQPEDEVLITFGNETEEQVQAQLIQVSEIKKE